MYCEIKYYYEFCGQDCTENFLDQDNEEFRAFNKSKGKDDSLSYYLESNLHFKDKDELDKHIEEEIESLSQLDYKVLNVEVVETSVDDYLDFLTHSIKYQVCKMYAEANNVYFGRTIREQNRKIRDKDFLANAYEYLYKSLK